MKVPDDWKPKPGEREAAEFLEQALGEELTWWDDGRTDGKCDCGIGDRIACEVSSFADEDAERQFTGASKYLTASPAPQLSSSWTVMVRAEAKLKTFARDAIPLFMDLERRGAARFSTWSVCAQPFCPEGGRACPAFRLARLGVLVADAVPGDPNGPQLHLSVALSGEGSRGPEDLVETIEQCVRAKPDLIAKLERENRHEGHLFFWVRLTRQKAYRPLSRRQSPVGTLTLPNVVTTVWVGIFGVWTTALCWTAKYGWRWVDID